MSNALSCANLLLPGPISMILSVASLNEIRSFKISLIRQSLLWISQYQKQNVHLAFFKSEQINYQTNKNQLKQPVAGQQLILSLLYALHTVRCSGESPCENAEYSSSLRASPSPGGDMNIH